MEKEQQKSVNFDKNAEVNVYNNGWDDDFDDDSDDEQEIATTPPVVLEPETKNKKVEQIELNKMDDVELRQETKQTFHTPVNNNPGRKSMRRSSMMRRRNTIYEPKPDGFSFDPTLASPIEARVITDICCFMLFFVFLAIWAFSTCLVFNMGNLERFGVPKDSDSASKNPAKVDSWLCGVSESVSYPYELNFNLFKCLDPLVAFRSCNTKSVCVSKCPNESYSYPYYKSQKNFNLTAKPSEDLKNKIQCIGVMPNFRSMNDVEVAIYTNEQCAEITTKYYNLTGSDYKTLRYKCIPDIFETEIDFIVDLLDNIVPQTNIPWRVTYEFTRQIGVYDAGDPTLDRPKKMYTFSDMLNGWPVLIVFLVVALILTLIMVYNMHNLAKFIFIISNTLNITILITSIYKCINRGYMFEEFSFNLFKNDIWGLLLVFTSIVAIIVLVQFVIERRGTLIILELIKEVTEAIKYIKTLLVFPLIFYCIRAAAILVSMYIGFTIKSTSETDFKLSGYTDPKCDCNGYSNGGFCNPTVISECLFEFDNKRLNCSMECKPVPDNEKLHTKLVDFSQLTNLIGYFWASEYLYLLEHAILASTFATYYWTFHKRDLPFFTLFNGFYTSIRYHLGTIFFAWLFLCLYSYIRFKFQFIDDLLGLLPFSIIHFFFKYVVIVMALCGDDFYESSKEVITIVKMNARLIIISKFMSEILFFYLKFLITVVMGILMYLVVLCFEFIIPGYFKNDLFPVYIVCMGTYFITTEIFNIYILGVDTFTFCYIEDVSINNGDMESPYFMPRPLMKICNLKNKLREDSYDQHMNLHSVK